MTEMKFQEIINKNRCPADYLNNEEGQCVPVDCARCDYDCERCVEDFINDYQQETDIGD